MAKWSNRYPDEFATDILDKRKAIRNYVFYMFDRTNQMFEYTGLPDTIPPEILELQLQLYGCVFFIRANDGNLYSLRGSLGGPPDPYFRGTQVALANPALNIETNFRIVNHFPPHDKATWDSMPPSVYMKNDMNERGLFPLYSRYATELAENDVSIRSAQINLRSQTLIIADTGPEIEAARKYIDDLVAGKLSAIARRPFLEGITTANATVSSSNTIIQLIELQQYLKASWFNELGLNSNFNMKREYLSAEEIKASTDTLLPLVDDMLHQRQIALDYVNSTFNTNISVDKNSAWKNKEEESEMVPEDVKQESSSDSVATESSKDGE